MKSKKITVSAPGKLMLFGEHAVVYGHPCIVTAVDQRMYVTVETNQTGNFTLEAPDVAVSNYSKPVDQIGVGEIPKGAQFIEFAVKNVIESKKIPGHLSAGEAGARNDNFEGLKITTRSEFSSKFGFGSSSASTVCVVKALSEIYSMKLTNQDIFKIAYKTVLDVQGKGSGFDVAAAVYGGTLYFVTGGKVIKPLGIHSIPLVVGYTGVKADTVKLINQVLEKSKAFPETVEGIYNLIEQIVEKAKPAILKGNWETAGELMNLNQGLLEALGVSSDKLSDMIYGARDNGAFGAKLSGAGGGDCMITLVSDKNKKAVEKGIEKAGGTIISVKTNAPGVRIEKNI